MFRIIAIVLVLIGFSLRAQTTLQDLMTISVVDSIAQEDYNTGWYNGYYSIRLATNGENVYLTTKKMWKEDGHNVGKILFGQRLHQGGWQFVVADTCADSVYAEPAGLIFDSYYDPFIFFVDRHGNDPYQFKVTHRNNGDWQSYDFVRDYPAGPPDWIDYVVEKYQDGFSLSAGPGGPVAWWWRDVVDSVAWDGVWYNRHLMMKRWDADTSTTVVVYDFRKNYWNYSRPIATKDGEYVAFSLLVPDSTVGYNDLDWYSAIYVYKWNGLRYVRDFADSVWFWNGSPCLEGFSLALGKKPNGDVLLIANGDLGRPIYLKSNGKWEKIVDNYEVWNGSSGASGRGTGNERIQFSQDGTAFWVDFDGFAAGFFSAELSFYTPDGKFGRLVLPAPDLYPDGGIFQSHDFVITDDDTLHFVYEFQPWAGHPKCLVEGKIYVPDLLQATTDIKARPATLPLGFVLKQNYPNPFNPTTTIEYFLPERTNVKLTVYDALGQKVRELISGFQQAGQHKVVFNAEGLSSGIYFYQLQGKGIRLMRKMILLK